MKKSYLHNLMIAIDQLFNAICGGNPDATISARIGYNSMKGNVYFLLLCAIVDFTFEPIDGKNHCYESYLADKEEKHKRGNDIALFGLGLVIIISCPIIGIVIRIINLIKQF